jgi:NADPH:quinone reductase-like Zn-dependent oxidoreductase
MAYPSINKSLCFTTPRGNLEAVEKPIPPLPANEILVKVKAASINPVDIQLWGSGLVAVVAGDKGMGRDFSGTVVAVGSGVKGWAEGDEIFGLLFRVVSFRLMGVNFLAELWKVWSRNIQSIHQRQPIFRSHRQETRMLHPRTSSVYPSCCPHCICMS